MSRVVAAGEKTESVPRSSGGKSAAGSYVIVMFVVGLAGTSSVADDRVVVANRTSPRQKVQRDHPGSMLSFASGSAIKIIKAGVKARR
jgi:hypothetical protein